LSYKAIPHEIIKEMIAIKSDIKLPKKICGFDKFSKMRVKKVRIIEIRKIGVKIIKNIFFI